MNMKKIRAMLCTALLLTVPYFTLSNPANNGMNHVIEYHGACGAPPATQNIDFCNCFFKESVKTCLEQAAAHHIPVAFCTEKMIYNNTKNAHNPALFCSQYAYMNPPEVSISECKEDMEYSKKYC